MLDFVKEMTKANNNLYNLKNDLEAYVKTLYETKCVNCDDFIHETTCKLKNNLQDKIDNIKQAEDKIRILRNQLIHLKELLNAQD